MRMHQWFGFGLVLAMTAGCAAPSDQAPAPAAPGQPAQAQPAPTGPQYTITYFEVAPAAARKTSGLLRTFANATRHEPGNVEFLALRETTRPGRFAIVEAWRDKAAHDAHGAAMQALGNRLQPWFASPFDVRSFWPLSVAAPGAGPLYVLTHVDVFPAGKEQVAALIREQVDASRKDVGVKRFDAVVQDGRPNHFHLIEAWTGGGARQAHALAPHSREFRAKLVPFEGALYDERLFEAIR